MQTPNIKGNMVKVYSHVVGNTLDSHLTIEKKLKRRGAKLQHSPDQSDYTIVFCPIVSRFETDIQSALSTVPGSRNVILVAMHHTYDPNYILPDKRSFDNTAVKLLVEFLFFEKKGLLKCLRNSKAKKAIWKEMAVKASSPLNAAPPVMADLSTNKKSSETDKLSRIFPIKARI
ncbi:hypothetical protein CCH79_00015584 [Gambusia affinis]|uniref:Uncharacterized protein n=1 Tax=Gambusia affinis TaxID=33528 RepID=A0A315VGD0_GAMAF|nr:hypothetical protein CCH79_00015584 [Gambusia affinis]